MTRQCNIIQHNTALLSRCRKSFGSDENSKRKRSRRPKYISMCNDAMSTDTESHGVQMNTDVMSKSFKASEEAKYLNQEGDNYNRRRKT